MIQNGWAHKADYTGFPEMLDGRVKTLHPKVHGGLLARRDLLRPDDETRLEALVRLHAGGAGERGEAMFRASLHAALTVAEVRELVASLVRDPAGVRQTSDRHWTWTCIEP